MTTINADRSLGQTFGDYLSGGVKHIFNASLRIPSFLANASAGAFIGEGSLRLVNVAKAALLQVPYSDVLASSDPNSWAGMIRPLGRLAVEEGAAYLVSNHDVLVGTAVMVGASIILSDVARVLCGNPPPIYNKVLSYIGPIRISDETVIAGRLGLVPVKQKQT